MYKNFNSLESLFAQIKEDKEWVGAEATLRNRYPIRFILFENFADFNEFIINRPQGIFKVAIDFLTHIDYPDIFPTFTDLSNNIKEYIKGSPAHDYVIFPFSEMTRFYEEREFVSLVKTIKGFEPPWESQNTHTRIYIPIVGMQSKMSSLMKDPNTFVWEYKSTQESEMYRLIITNGSRYGVMGLEDSYSYVANLREWLKLWTKGQGVRRNIICTSKTIFANAANAQPDNAFSYEVCNNAYDFLINGLKLDLDGMSSFREEDIPMWEKLASIINVENLNFRDFINNRFDTNHILTEEDFIKVWFECETDFDRWLISLYFRAVKKETGYICDVLSQCRGLSTSELFTSIAIQIFEDEITDEKIHTRNIALQEAAKQNVKLTEVAEQQLYQKLSDLAYGTPEMRNVAIKLLTTLSVSERRLIIELLGKGLISINEVEKIYPDFYHYMSPFKLQIEQKNQWVISYFDAYRLSKVSNSPVKVQPYLSELNKNQTSFDSWYDKFKTVKTLLYNRQDVDILYWIDGLGVDWIPFISYIISKHKLENVYLNEVYIARALLPTITSTNKLKLEDLVTADRRLEKIGDLDSFAHQHKFSYPDYVIQELNIVEKAVMSVLSQYNGKKIAFVSDHGLTYMAQYGKGLKLAGITGDHEGRVAIQDSGNAISDSKYVILDDKKTICSLTIDSLTSKTAIGHGAHGGATPEEVLVPIIIVSSQPNASTYSAKIINSQIGGTNPVVRFEIKGINSIDIPEIEYNESIYSLHNDGLNIFVSEKLNLVDTAKSIILHIGEYKQTFNVSIYTGAEEDDLFGDL